MDDKHIIFDLDGTLIDSRQEILETYRKVFTAIPSSKKIDYQTINYGATLQSVLENVYTFDKELVKEAKTKFSEIYDYSSYQNTLVYPSVKDVLNFFYTHNFRLHIATNKRLKPTLNILSKKEISFFFTNIEASDMGIGKLISKEEMVRKICHENRIQCGYMIGDSVQDIDAGKASNLATIAVTYGYEKIENLLKKKPTFVINNLLELYNILKLEI